MPGGMLLITSLLTPLAAAISWTLCRSLLALAPRWNLIDAAGSEAHKPAGIGVPNVGGVALFWAVALPVAAALLAAVTLPVDAVAGVVPALAVHLPGLRSTLGEGAALLAGLAALHALGLVDDRRALGPLPKLAAQAAVAAALVTLGGSRAMTLLDDALPGGGGWLLSTTLTVLWVLAIVNAMNFLDNMDGLAAGVGAVAAGVFAALAIGSGQWFVAALCFLLLGGLLGFLWFNRPPARLYLGDGGSLVLGGLLAVISVRLTYAGAGPLGVAPPHAVFVPLVVLAVPLYDLVSVSVIRLRAGVSPMTGDRNHFSHRLVRLGLPPAAAVAVVWLATLATGLGGLLLPRVSPAGAAVVVAQCGAVLLTLAVLEAASLRAAGAGGRAAASRLAIRRCSRPARAAA